MSWHCKYLLIYSIINYSDQYFTQNNRHTFGVFFFLSLFKNERICIRICFSRNGGGRQSTILYHRFLNVWPSSLVAFRVCQHLVGLFLFTLIILPRPWQPFMWQINVWKWQKQIQNLFAFHFFLLPVLHRTAYEMQDLRHWMCTTFLSPSLFRFHS